MPLLRDQLFARVALESGFLPRAAIEQAFSLSGGANLFATLQSQGWLSPEQVNEVARRADVLRLRCLRCGHVFGDRELPAGDSFNCPRCGTVIADLFRLQAGWENSPRPAPAPGPVQRAPTATAMPAPNPGYGRPAAVAQPAAGSPQSWPGGPGAAPPAYQPPPAARVTTAAPGPAPSDDPTAKSDKKRGYQELIGTALGGFALDQFLGKGAHGWVFKASHPKANVPLAVKVVPQAVVAQYPVVLKRLEREATILRGVVHPNLIRIFGHGREQGYHFLAMEFVDGKTLQSILADWKEPNIEHGIDLFRQVLTGLGVAHERGVIHRDLKPDNIMVTLDGVVKIMDFGLSREDEYEENVEAPGLTMQGEILGTPHYMSPEQAEADKITNRADIYAIGATFYHVFTGSVPFDDKRVVRIIRAHMKDPPDPPRKRNAKVPQLLERVLLKMLEKKPDKRFQSCAEALAALEPLGAGTRVVAAAVPKEGFDFPELALLLLGKEGVTEGWLSEDRFISAVEENGKLLLFSQILKKSGYVPPDMDRRISTARAGHRRELTELEARIIVESGIATADTVKRELPNVGEAGLGRRLVDANIISEAVAQRLDLAARDYFSLVEDMIFGKMAVRKNLINEAQYNDLIHQRTLEQRLEVGLRQLQAPAEEIAEAKRDTIRYMLKKPLPKLKIPRIQA